MIVLEHGSTEARKHVTGLAQGNIYYYRCDYSEQSIFLYVHHYLFGKNMIIRPSDRARARKYVAGLAQEHIFYYRCNYPEHPIFVYVHHNLFGKNMIETDGQRIANVSMSLFWKGGILTRLHAYI